MKFNKSRQLLLVSAASLLLAGALTACSSLTVDFVYVTSAKAAGSSNYGEVDVFEIDSESGFMRQIPTSPFPSGGRNPVASAVSPDFTNLYVVNQDDNSIVQFIIGNDGKLYPQNTVNTPGAFPLAVAVSGSYLYVVDTYLPSTCSSEAPCSGSVAVYPIQPASGSGDNAVPAGALGTPVTNGASYCQGTIAATNFWPLLNGCTDVVKPTGIAVLSSGSASYIYISAYDSTSNSGYIFGFSAGSNGALVPLNGGTPVAAGIYPSAIAAVGGQYIYATDYSQGKVLSYSASSSGTLTALTTTRAGNQPSALIADSTGSYLYVANQADSNVIAYTISGGALNPLGTYATGLQPVALGIDPNLHQFLYTANFLGNSVSGFELSATNGSLINSQNTPYSASAQPTSVAAIPHNGNKK